jgi:ankyrin repeat protein
MAAPSPRAHTAAAAAPPLDEAAAAAAARAAFFSACARGSVAALEATPLDAALLRARDAGGALGLDLAARGGHLPAMTLLLARGAHVNGHQRSRPPLCYAADAGEAEAVRLLLSNPYSRAAVDARDEFGFTALLEAAKGNQTAVLAVLLAAGADTAARGAVSGNAALHLAAERNFGRAVGALLGAGADCKCVGRGAAAGRGGSVGAIAP